MQSMIYMALGIKCVRASFMTRYILHTAYSSIATTINTSTSGDSGIRLSSLGVHTLHIICAFCTQSHTASRRLRLVTNGVRRSEASHGTYYCFSVAAVRDIFCWRCTVTAKCILQLACHKVSFALKRTRQSLRRSVNYYAVGH